MAVSGTVTMLDPGYSAEIKVCARFTITAGRDVLDRRVTFAVRTYKFEDYAVG